MGFTEAYDKYTLGIPRGVGETIIGVGQGVHGIAVGFGQSAPGIGKGLGFLGENLPLIVVVLIGLYAINTLKK